VFAAMGFYPLDPVSGNYLLVSPLFDAIEIKLPDNKLLKLITHRSTEDAKYIKELKWNGKVYDKNYLRHASIIKGGKLEI